MSIYDQFAETGNLPQLIQVDNFVGWIFKIDYERACVITNDNWKAKVGGIPHNCFLLASALEPKRYAEAKQYEKEVILLRVINSCNLPMDDDVVRTKIEHYQEQRTITASDKQLDDLTLNQMQFGGLECRVLGTFYSDSDSGELLLGSDLENYHSAVRLQVYKPTTQVLGTIVNYISPVRKRAAQKEAEKLGIRDSLPDFPIGNLRYTSTQRLQKEFKQNQVIFNVQSIDFLSRRTGVFGMTRTGKSNTIKQLVSVVKRTADKTGMKIGQIIYDLNGEYANANQQDDGSSIFDAYLSDTERYRLLEAPGFKLMQNNFYTQIVEGFSIIRHILKERSTSSADVTQFLEVSFEEPDKENRGEHNRWRVKKAIYQTMLFKAGFSFPNGLKITFPVSKAVCERVDSRFSPNSSKSLELTPQQAVDWFNKARDVNKNKNGPLLSFSGNNWFDEDAVALLNMLAKKSSGNTHITGYNHLSSLKAYHSADRKQDVSEEIYQHLLAGKIVILDLSVGDPEHRERLAKMIAKHIFDRSMRLFNEGAFPPHIVIYIEEAHNLIGRKDDLTDVWPRIAKEGAKCRIASVYSTQEMSSIHPNILSNTENMFVSHLNNEDELRELSKFYDFSDFRKSLIRAQDVGFSRVKTLSSPFVIPVQIHEFSPQNLKDDETES